MDVKIKLCNENYVVAYNQQTMYYEFELNSPIKSGIYEIEIVAEDALGNSVTSIKKVQILAEKEIEIKNEDGICYIIDSDTLEIKDVKALVDYELNEDDETNETSDVIFPSKFMGKDDDYVVIKANKRIFYGIFSDINQEKNDNSYTAKIKYINNIFDEDIFVDSESIIREKGVEDFIKYTIEKYFSKSNDILLNKNYIQVIVKTHTKLEKKVDNEDGKYNFHTYITNCKQNYDIDMKFEFKEKKLIITIEKQETNSIFIDCTVADVTNYKETFEKKITAKVRVRCKDTGNIKEYFLNADRKVIDNINDENRVKGKTASIVVESEEEAYQSAVDRFKGNSYNYLVEFDLNKNSKLMDETKIITGRKVKIKTKSNVIVDGYITARIDKKDNKIISFKSGKIRRQLTRILKQKGGM